MRIKFKKNAQRKFIRDVLIKTNCPSLRSLISRGFNISYSTLKSYYNEYRTLPEMLFRDLCIFASIDPLSLDYTTLSDKWGQKKGGEN
jgi:hypothetical protein